MSIDLSRFAVIADRELRRKGLNDVHCNIIPFLYNDDGFVCKLGKFYKGIGIRPLEFVEFTCDYSFVDEYGLHFVETAFEKKFESLLEEMISQKPNGDGEKLIFIGIESEFRKDRNMKKFFRSILYGFLLRGNC